VYATTAALLTVFLYVGQFFQSYCTFYLVPKVKTFRIVEAALFAPPAASKH